jgi:hypothetical protein
VDRGRWLIFGVASDGSPKNSRLTSEARAPTVYEMNEWGEDKPLFSACFQWTISLLLVFGTGHVFWGSLRSVHQPERIIRWSPPPGQHCRDSRSLEMQKMPKSITDWRVRPRRPCRRNRKVSSIVAGVLGVLDVVGVFKFRKFRKLCAPLFARHQNRKEASIDRVVSCFKCNEFCSTRLARCAPSRQ